MRDYYLHQRKNGIYLVEYINKVNGLKLSARSTKEREELKAQIKVELWLINGVSNGRIKKPRTIEEAAEIETIIKIICKSGINSDDGLRIVSTLKSMGLINVAAVKNTGRGAVVFTDFLQTFYDYDKSEYIQDKLSHGYRFSRNYAHGCQNRIKAELIPFFAEKKLNCVTIDELKKLSNQLAAGGLSTATINQILLICCTPLKWAFNEKIIPVNLAVGLTKFSITNKERGILTEKEAAALFSVDWKDKRVYVASLISATTGARMGECLALRRSDICTDTINISHNYSRIDGLKCPKNGHKRIAPLLPEVRVALMDLLKNNPHIDAVPDPFIFYSLSPDKPCDNKFLLEGFKDAMDSVNNKYMENANKAKLENPEIHIDYKP
jgi:integrase